MKSGIRFRVNFLNCVKDYAKKEEDNLYDASYTIVKKGQIINAPVYSGNWSRRLTKDDINRNLSSMLSMVGYDLECSKLEVRKISVYQNPEILSELFVVIEV